MTGLEYTWDGLRLTERSPTVDLIQGSAEALPFADWSYDVVLLLGVVEHLEDDVLALREAARVCRPDGAVILLTSALPFLWSHHDEANRHQRRYWRRELSTRLHHAGLQPRRLSYQNFVTLLPTLVVRLWQCRSRRSLAYDWAAPHRRSTTCWRACWRWRRA